MFLCKIFSVTAKLATIFGDNKSQLDYLCIDIYGKQRQPYQEVRMAEFAVLQLCYMLIERIHVLIGLKMLCQLNKVLPLVAAITRLASASIGDRSNVHQECLQQCHTKNKCHEKAPARFVQGNVVAYLHSVSYFFCEV